MNSSMFNNGISYLVNNGINEDKAFMLVNKTSKELSSMPISMNIEDCFYVHLKLLLDIEVWKHDKDIHEQETRIRLENRRNKHKVISGNYGKDVIVEYKS